MEAYCFRTCASPYNEQAPRNGDRNVGSFHFVDGYGGSLAMTEASLDRIRAVLGKALGYILIAVLALLVFRTPLLFDAAF